jgi:multiple antibiotic resistance protein
MHEFTNAGTLALVSFFTLFAVAHPLGAITSYQALTSNVRRRTAVATAFYGVLFAFVFVASFAASGRYILEAFGVTRDAFRVAGGVLIFLMGLKMLAGELSPVKVPRTVDPKKLTKSRIGIAFVPLAVPLLSGPASLAVAMTLTETGSAQSVVIVVSAIFAVQFVGFFVLLFGRQIQRRLGPSGLGVVCRLLGLILTVVAAQMIVSGITRSFETRHDKESRAKTHSPAVSPKPEGAH